MLKTFLTTFGLVFLAELGDKTQLTTMLMASHNESFTGVFLGAACALLLSTVIGITVGAVISKYVPTNYIHTAAGTAFIIIGIFLISGKF
jgi:putative Ca2+/H+ antiporter (TMEM165/GDT1 family)